jgi:hypothetical protein
LWIGSGCDLSRRSRHSLRDPKDCAAILGFIRELAEYERLAHEVVADGAA